MVKVRSVRATSSRIVLELEKPKRVTKFKPSAKEKTLAKIAKEALDQLRKSYDEIETELELTEKGISIIQTSANEKVVALLQQHASEISDMVDRGMEAVHERMMTSSHQYIEKHHHQGDDDDYDDE